MRVRNGKLVLSEAQITRQCIDYLRAEGWTCKRQHVGTFIPVSVIWGLIGQSREWVKKALGKNTLSIGSAGDPDWLVLRGGYPGKWSESFYIEFKTQAGILSDDQRERIRQLHEDGFLVCVCRGLDDLREWMRENL